MSGLMVDAASLIKGGTLSFRKGADGIAQKTMSFRPGKKGGNATPQRKVKTISFHPKIENDSLPVSVSECNRIIAVSKPELADGLEVGDRIVAVDGVELVGPLEYSTICNDKRGCEATVERTEGCSGHLVDGEDFDVELSSGAEGFGFELNMFGRIAKITEGGPADAAGLQSWDRIKSVDGTPLFETRDMAQFFAGKNTVSMFVMRPPRSNAWYKVIATHENHKEAVAQKREASG